MTRFGWENINGNLMQWNPNKNISAIPLYFAEIKTFPASMGNGRLFIFPYNYVITLMFYLISWWYYDVSSLWNAILEHSHLLQHDIQILFGSATIVQQIILLGQPMTYSADNPAELASLNHLLFFLSLQLCQISIKLKLNSHLAGQLLFFFFLLPKDVLMAHHILLS